MFSPMSTELVGAAILAGLALALGGRAVKVLRRSPLSTPQSLLFGLNYVMSRVLWRATISGTFDLPAGSGAIIVSNHRSPVDPSFFYLATRRVVRWMVAREYCIHPAMAWFFRIVESIPVGRGGIDTAATRLAIRHARAGGLVGMFPEGRINDTSSLMIPGRPGAAMIALRARVPIVPIYIQGSPYNGSVFGSVLLPAKVHLTIGSPIDLSDYYGRADDRAAHHEVTFRLLRQIAALAGRVEYEPRIAGRNDCQPAGRGRLLGVQASAAETPAGDANR